MRKQAENPRGKKMKDYLLSPIFSNDTCDKSLRKIGSSAFIRVT